MIELRRASIIRNGRILLYPVNLTLECGVLAMVTGPNGAGKTTLLRLMAGLWRPSEGKILFDGQRPSVQHRGQIGLVLQESMLYGRLTVQENLRFFGGLYRVRDLDDRIRQLAKELHFERRLGDPVSVLSKGYTQRVTLARALLPNPRLLLLDEPFDGLDPGVRGLVKDVLALRVAEGTTVVVVTHDPELMPNADMQILVNRGRVTVVSSETRASRDRAR
ncbi:ABC transporter ATP-binding protein [Kyrpidia spormannii]|uniref:Sodium ABC transporter ATP-binding protein n=1 Tax=Kyrpidia spormannii TaxID=2055160 RepID=A0A6F9EGF2_9BACL|nr:ABC transporter ATP-binding protein [Kyrpidia spormannii]CAB3395411.1 Sodium ABC transporter ATP-binding protein [Kyrpidia spormannii]